MGRALRCISQDIRYNPIFVKESVLESMRGFFEGEIDLSEEMQSRVLSYMKETKEEAKRKIQSACPHDLLILGTTENGEEIKVCPICYSKKCASQGENLASLQGGNVLDFRNHETCIPIEVEESTIIDAFRTMIVEDANSEPRMGINTWISTIPEELYISAAVVKKILADKTKRR